MAWQKEFDPERSLAKAMSLFWRMGYENTSLEALIKEMGIARQSLYDTFGDKRALYLKAMAHYRDQTNSQMQKMLNEIPTVRDGFGSLLYGLAAETREQHERGCLLLSANLQRDPKMQSLGTFCATTRLESKQFFLRLSHEPKNKGNCHQRRPCCSGALLCRYDSRNASDGQAQVRQESAGTGRPSHTRRIQFVENRQIEEILHANPDSAFTLWIFPTSSVYADLRA